MIKRTIEMEEWLFARLADESLRTGRSIDSIVSEMLSLCFRAGDIDREIRRMKATLDSLESRLRG